MGEDISPLGHAWNRLKALEEERDELQRKLDIAVEALKNVLNESYGDYYSRESDIAKEALKKLEA